MKIENLNSVFGDSLTVLLVKLEGSLDPDNFSNKLHLKRIDLWGNEEILDLAEIDSRGEFTFQLAGVTDLLTDLEPELETGVLSDWWRFPYCSWRTD